MNITNIPTAEIDNSYFENNHKILIFKILEKITEPSIRKLIWEKLIKAEEEEITKLLRQDWFDNIGKIIQDLYNSTDYIDIYSDYNSD